VRLERLGQWKESNALMGNGISDLLARSTVREPTALPRAPENIKSERK
jgi:hypothetical protein